MQENDTISIKKDTLWKYSTFVLLAIVVIGGFFLLKGDSTGSVVVNPNTGGNTAPVKVDGDDDAILGNENAPVTIIEFSDYQCPFCERFWSQTYPLIKSEYIDTGKVKLIYRDFPLTSIHPMAMPAAIAVECVREQGGDEAYYEMHDKIFENQASLSESNLKKWAQELSYNIDSCLDSEKYLSEVEADLREGAAAGVRGTPSFFINEQPLSGAQPFSEFKRIIDAELQ